MKRPATDLLVVAPNWLGDLVMTTPLLDTLAAAGRLEPDRPLRVTLAVRRRWAPLVEADPRLDRILTLSRTGAHRGLAGLWRLARDWRRRHSAVLLLPPSLRVAAAAALAGIGRRVGYRCDGRGWLLTDSLALPRRGLCHYSGEMWHLGRIWARHVAERDWPDGPVPRPSLPGCDATSAAADAGTEEAPLWALAVGATYGSAKAWPRENLVRFLHLATEQAGARVVLLGDAAAVPEAAALRRAAGPAWRGELPGGPGVVDLVGRTDLTRVVSLLKACSLFVGNDSGLMHLAAALGVATIGIFGSSSPAWTAPRGRETAAVAAEGFACRPCFRPECDQPRFCLAEIDAERVLANARELLAGTGSGGEA